jgi:hypothetical protein
MSDVKPGELFVMDPVLNTPSIGLFDLDNTTKLRTSIEKNKDVVFIIGLYTVDRSFKDRMLIMTKNCLASCEKSYVRLFFRTI